MASKRRTWKHIQTRTDTGEPRGQRDSENKYSLDRVDPERVKFHNT